MKVTRNYRVTIPEEVRETLGIKEGDIVEVDVAENERARLRRIIPIAELEGAWDAETEKWVQYAIRLSRNRLPTSNIAMLRS